MHLSVSVKWFILTILLSSSLLSDNNKEKIKLLSQDKYWHTLLHFKNGESQVDSKEFFLSKDGRQNSFLELNATINSLINPIKLDDNSSYCKFPARREWIKENFHNISMKIQKCHALEKELSLLKKINKITLVFPTTHINSPASIFGHTLLRLDSDENKMISYAVNYAALTNEENGFIYAFNGLFGGYKGRYSIVPYYSKLQEYSNLENRDIWEYELEFSLEDIKRFNLHLIELKKNWAYYFFTNRNCSYELLWLLQSANKNLELTKNFNYKAIPIETIQELKKNNLIKKTVYRPSKRKILLTYFDKIKDKDLALSFIKTHNLELLKNKNKDEKINILGFSILLLQHKQINKKIDKKTYLKLYLSLLKYRSKLGKEKLIVKEPASHLKAHSINKFSIQFHSNDSLRLGIKPVMHSFYDINYGYLDGAYIDFFKFDFEIKKETQELINFSFFDIKSLAVRDEVFKPYSWQIDFGAKRLNDDKLYVKLKAGGGLSYAIGNALFYTILNISDFNNFDKNFFAYGYELGIEYNFSDKKIGAYFLQDFFESDSIIEGEIFFTQRLSKDTAFNIGYEHLYQNENIHIGYYYYF